MFRPSASMDRYCTARRTPWPRAHCVSGAVVAFGLFLGGCPAATSRVASPLAALEATQPAQALAGEAGVDATASALARVGGQVYLAEGCYTCHGSPAPWLEVPDNWTSEGKGLLRVLDARTRERGLAWHHRHFIAPRALVPGSIMPSYAFLADDAVTAAMLDAANTADDGSTRPAAIEAYEAEAQALAAELATAGIETRWDSRLVALLGVFRR